MIRPKRFKNNFPNAVVGNARLLRRGLGRLWQTFLKRRESVGQNTAKRRMIRPKRFKNNFPNAVVGNARLLRRGLGFGKLS